ncbi:hypothetical protein ACHQM5_007995 [Ranunculus cassubicifolius]
MAAAAVLSGFKRSLFEQEPSSTKGRYGCYSSPATIDNYNPFPEPNPSKKFRRTSNTHAPSPPDNYNPFSNPPAAPTDKIPTNGAEWVELLVSEMTRATGIDNAKVRATNILQGLENSIRAEAGVQVENLQKENATFKEQMEVLSKVVVKQFQRLKEADNKIEEVENLKQTIQRLEIKNYGLKVNLQAQNSKCIPMNFHPDVY